MKPVLAFAVTYFTEPGPGIHKAIVMVDPGTPDLNLTVLGLLADLHTTSTLAVRIVRCAPLKAGHVARNS